MDPTVTQSPALPQPRIDPQDIITAAKQSESEVPVTVARYWVSLTVRERPAQHRRDDRTAAFAIAGATQALIDADPLVTIRYQALDFHVHAATRDQRQDGTTSYTIEIVMDEAEPGLSESEHVQALGDALHEAIRAGHYKPLVRSTPVATVHRREPVDSVAAGQR